jgi:2-methylaconitate cis-trans-isomerase PrpF
MHGQQTMIRCSIYRGGTSKGIYLLDNDLPRDPVTRDRVILALYGSPDPRQIDGLGGADPLTSKVAIISRSDRAGVDVDYTFGQVGITTPDIDYSGNCGNISAGVGPFAIDEGLVKAVEPVTLVRIFNTNTNKVIVAHVPVVDGKAAVEGNYAMAGVPRSGARILLDFLRPTGAITGKLLPTGQTRDVIAIEGYGSLTVSIVDAGNPVVFVRAEDIGMRGPELPDEIESDPALLATLEQIRSSVAEMIGLVRQVRGVREISKAVPKMIVVASRQAYHTSEGREVKADEMNLVARAMSMQRVHKAYPITGAICTAVAASMDGTVPWEVASDPESGRVCIGHPMGVLPAEVKIEQKGDGYHVERVTLVRTSRRLMAGYAYVPNSAWLR